MSSTFQKYIINFFNSEGILLKPFVSLENETATEEYMIAQGNGSFSYTASTKLYRDSLFVREVGTCSAWFGGN